MEILSHLFNDNKIIFDDILFYVYKNILGYGFRC